MHIGAGHEDASESASEKMRKVLPQNASVNTCLEISSLCLTASRVHGVVIERKVVVLKDDDVVEKRRRSVSVSVGSSARGSCQRAAKSSSRADVVRQVRGGAQASSILSAQWWWRAPSERHSERGAQSTRTIGWAARELELTS